MDAGAIECPVTLNAGETVGIIEAGEAVGQVVSAQGRCTGVNAAGGNIDLSEVEEWALLTAVVQPSVVSRTLNALGRVIAVLPIPHREL